jgi:cullin 1
LEATRAYYKAESQAFVANNSVSDYMRKAESRLDEESARIQLYLNSSTEKEVRGF